MPPRSLNKDDGEDRLGASKSSLGRVSIWGRPFSSCMMVSVGSRGWKLGGVTGLAGEARQWVIQAPGHENLMLKKRGDRGREYQEATVAANQYSPAQIYYALLKVVDMDVDEVVDEVADQELHGES